MSQSQHRVRDTEVEVDFLLEHISKTKGFLLPMTKKFFENNINFNTPFDEQTKSTLKERMLEFLKIENELKSQQQASTRLQFQVQLQEFTCC